MLDMLFGSAPRLVLPANARAADVDVDVDGKLVCVCTSNSTIHLARILTDRYFYYIYGIFFLANVMFPSPLDMMCGRYLWGLEQRICSLPIVNYSVCCFIILL